MAGRRLRTVFFGSSEFSVPSLERLLEHQDVVAVCSQPDKPSGRGLALTPTPVTIAARRAGRDVLTPARFDAEFIESIAKLGPQLLASASYGKILPASLLELPGMAALNVHPSLLPRYRGATPIQSALRDGCEQTGVTVFWMTPRMDAGDIAVARIVPIEPSDDYGALHDRLAVVGAELLDEAAMLLAEERLPRNPQREEDATYSQLLAKNDLQINFATEARSVVNQIRSLSPRPGAWMLFEGKRLKVLKAEVVESGRSDGTSASPGSLVSNDPTGPVLAALPGAIRLLEVIPEGKPHLTGAEFARRTASRR